MSKNPYSEPSAYATTEGAPWWRRVMVVPIACFVGWFVYVVLVQLMWKFGIYEKLPGGVVLLALPGFAAGHVAARVGRPAWLWPSVLSGVLLTMSLLVFSWSVVPSVDDLYLPALWALCAGIPGAALGGFLAHRSLTATREGRPVRKTTYLEDARGMTIENPSLDQLLAALPGDLVSPPTEVWLSDGDGYSITLLGQEVTLSDPDENEIGMARFDDAREVLDLWILLQRGDRHRIRILLDEKSGV
jgi:hypothetical protein